MNTLPPDAPSSPVPRPIAITQGDPAGIGPEIIARLFVHQPALARGCVVVGDEGTMRRALRCVLGGELAWPVVELAHWSEWAQCPPRCLPLLCPPALADASTGWLAPWGVVDARAGRMAAQCVEHAARAGLAGEVLALVTAPLHKEAMHQAGAPYGAYPGHTELLQSLAAEHQGKPVAQVPVRMMLANDDLRVVLVSVHVSLRQAIAAVTFDNVLETLHIAHRSLSQILGREPNLAVAGLNPHAGEGGLFGSEELAVIGPAVAAARACGVEAVGPLAPDTVFMQARRVAGAPPRFDAVIAMYHDQGLIPVKYLGLDQGVNVTLGLPLIRTSPDHGTAFDIAGSGRADPSSLFAAVAMARQLAGCAV
jgi:4-hydroxythreonine-4-phosphate dehydrogenase